MRTVILTACQVGGLLAAAAGLYLLAGLAVTLVVVGLAVCALGVAAELGNRGRPPAPRVTPRVRTGGE